MCKKYSIQELRLLFQRPFALNTWYAVLKNILGCSHLNTTPESLSSPAANLNAYSLGMLNTTDGYQIALLFYISNDHPIEQNHVTIKQAADSLAKEIIADAALAVFSDNQKWQLSLICDLKNNTHTPKRYSYIFGDNKYNYHVATTRFYKLQAKTPSFKFIKDIFSVESLSEEFFMGKKVKTKHKYNSSESKDYIEWHNKFLSKNKQFGYIQWYKLFLSYVLEHRSNSKLFASFFNNCDDKIIRDYIKKLFGRIVFLFFIQKKGWLGCPTDTTEWSTGNQRFMQELFQYASEDQQQDYLNSVLEPLFFECLNQKRPDDIYDTHVKEIGSVRIPFLNGGLFEKSESDALRSIFPSEYFQGLFNFFDQYQYTIVENDPFDAEMSIDPEMLGKIFENLLECNKDLGVFYTPKEIVQYMCQESLISFLLNHDTIRSHTNRNQFKAIIRNLVEHHEISEEIDNNMRAILLNAIQSIKICDPAIGSGAFPIGLLNELVKCRQTLGDKTDLYSLKKEIIQNSIYGVDIDPGAVDIARLRFWLSLVVNANSPEPLPNLNDNIRQGNSLLELSSKNEYRFDIVIGNPPYGVNMSNSDKIIFKQLYHNLKGKFDIYMVFWELGLSISQSVVCYITPDKWLSNSYALSFRKNAMIPYLSNIAHLGNSQFSNAFVDAIVSLFNKHNDSDIIVRTCDPNNHITQINTINPNEIKPPFFIDEYFRPSSALVKHLDSLPKRLKDYIKCEYASVNAKEAYQLKEIIYDNEFPDRNNLKVLITGTIHKYSNQWGKKTTKFLGSKFNHPVVQIDNLSDLLGKSFTKRMCSPKCIIKSLNLLDATIDLNGEYMSHVATLIIIPKTRELLMIVTAIINSPLVSQYIKEKYFASSFCGGQKFTPYMIESIPVPDLSEIIHDSEKLNKLENAIQLNDIDYCERFVHALMYTQKNE